MSVSPSQLATLLKATIPAGLHILVTGKPGIGKTDILTQVTAAINYDLVVSHPVTSDPTKAEGLPWVYQTADGPRAAFIPLGELELVYAATRPTVWLIDDLGQAAPSTQASFMGQLHPPTFNGKRIAVNGHSLPECVTILAATNRRVDRAGVSGILEPVKSRFTSIVELEPDIDAWCQWAYGHGISPMLIAFLRFRPDLLCNFQATADLTNSPVPRTWHSLAKLEALTLPTDIESSAMSGAVGEGPALEYLSFRSMYKSMVNLDAILLNPDKTAIPSKPDQLYATAVGLAARANDTNFSRIATYATRLAVEANRGEFAVLMVRDAIRRDEKIQYTDSFVRLNSGPIGQLISGK